MTSFFYELRRRKVFRVVAGYLAIAWLGFEVVAGVEEAAGLPAWSDSVALIVLVMMFPAVVFAAWAFEITPAGIKATPSADEENSEFRRPPRLIDYLVIGAILVFASLIAWQQINRTITTGVAPLQASNEVNIVTPGEAEQEASRQAAQTNAIANAPELSVAVLPFLMMSAEENDVYFADGLTEEILNSLAMVPDLLVTSRTSAFQFRGQDLPPIPEIAASLGVAHILEGSVRRSGDQVRITAQLIRAEDDSHLWSQTYDRSLENVFEIQEDIASNVARVLEVVLSEENRRQMANSGTRDIEAFIAFQQAMELWHRGHTDEGDAILELADPIFAQAIGEAPDYSEAYLMRSDWYAHQLTNPENAENTELLEIARTAQADLLADALETADTPARRAVVQANQIMFSDDWTNARAVMRDALTNDECANDNWLQDFLLLYEELDMRRDYLERLVACDPLNSTIQSYFGSILLIRGEYEEALAYSEELRRRDMTFEYETLRYNALLGLRRLEEAEAMIQPEWGLEQIQMAAMRGDEAAAREFIEPYISEDIDWFNLMLRAWLGDREEANRLATAIDARPYGFIELMSIFPACMCGAPFDLEAVPNFTSRLDQAVLPWPPPGDLGYPLMQADVPEAVTEN
ncbi:hypothetical protein [Hyphobacterium sp.]|uniref:hypothetical protein n=1 Tax=Hyphobacterium sp. TaxID=2004662 RepID=UPI003BA949C4